MSVCRYASGIQSLGSIFSSASTRAWKRSSRVAVSLEVTCKASLPSESSPCVYTHASTMDGTPAMWHRNTSCTTFSVSAFLTMPESLDQATQSLLTRFHRQKPVRSGSLLITVLGDSIAPRGGIVTLGSLIRLAEPFGLPDRLVRTSVGRLASEGWLAWNRE